MKRIEDLLLKYWGFEVFKPQQEKIINSIINNINTLVVLPTGGGKSLCYQLPSLVIGGTTLVISPLIALMEDQVRALNQKGISAFYFKSDSTRLTIDQQLDNCIHGNYSLVYCSPERLRSSDFLYKISKANIKHIAIDEAHCISEWGHEFRPSYRKIKELINMFHEIVVTAYTGSATLEVKQDIIENLELKNSKTIEVSYQRKNIFYEIYHVKNKVKGLLSIVENKSSIIYCNTRKSSEFVSKRLSDKGFLSDYFHGGMSREEKEEKLLKWHSEKIKIIVATTAFGMGIDKPNVRKIIHYNLPESLERYYQETGRAGRDGKKSKAITLINPEEKKSFIKNTLNSLPSKDDLTKTYKNICNYLQIPIGEGQGNYYDFDLIYFCKKYKLAKNITLNILHFLENNGLLVLTYIKKNKIKIDIKADINSIKETIKLSTKQSRVIEGLLRFYPNIFNKKTEISVEKLEQHTKLSPKEVVKSFEFYNKMNLLNLNMTSSDLQIYWSKPREDNYSVNPLINRLNKLNSIRRIKLENIIDFVYNDEKCKTKQLLKYFGEDKKYNCMNCSSFCCK